MKRSGDEQERNQWFYGRLDCRVNSPGAACGEEATPTCTHTVQIGGRDTGGMIQTGTQQGCHDEIMPSGFQIATL